MSNGLLRVSKRLRVYDELQPLPDGLTPHAMRRTYVSLRVAVGNDPVAIAKATGHANAAGMTLRIYAGMMDEDEGARKRLAALASGTEWAPIGTTESKNAESAAISGSALEETAA